MSSIIADANTLENQVLQLLSAEKEAHPREVDASIMAMMCVERDTRFYGDTLRAVLHQSVLPKTLVVVDCAHRVEEIVQTSIDITLDTTLITDFISSENIAESSNSKFMRDGVSNIKSNTHKDSRSIRIIIVPVSFARSFGDAIEKALRQLLPLRGVKALWLLHDDSRPADSRCLEELRDTWRNTPTASVLGAKQVDWQGKILHNVGMYAWNHGVHTLTVDGEQDQEQYDGRGDVYSVSLSGALVTLSAWQTMRGTQPWMTTFGESKDFCRRVCVSGGRVVVVPRAKIAHRRARFEGLRTRSGEARSAEKSGINHGVMSVLIAKQRYKYTDMRIVFWPLLWILSLPSALVLALKDLFIKRPYSAWAHLILPWIIVMHLPQAIFARRRVARSTRVSTKRLSALIADRHQIARWRDRVLSYQSQLKCVLLSPLARRHLHMRVLRRWSAVTVSSLILLAVTLWLYGAPWREVIAGASLYSDQWLPTGADFSKLLNAAVGSWTPDDSFGPALPPSSWLSVWTLASIPAGFNPLLAISLMYFMAAPAMCLSFWALAGVFTRSDLVRVCSAICWTMLAMAFGLFARGDLPMLMTMVFLPAAFAFAFHAVGMYVTEDPVLPVPSVQCAACAALCFMIPVACEPQLLLPLICIFIVALIMVRSHRFMLALMPVPAVLILLPTLGSVLRYFSTGLWRQMFASAALPLQSVDGAPDSLGYAQVLLRAFNMNSNHGISQSMPLLSLRGIIMIIFATLAVVMAVVSLLLPFALRVSRMMWAVMLSGIILSLVASRITVAVDVNGSVAASVLPGVALTALGVLSCMCMVAGQAVRRFEPLKKKRTNNSVPEGGYKTRASRRAAMRRSAALLLRKIIYVARCILAFGMLIMAVLLGLFAVLSGPVASVNATNSGLPMVVTDYLDKSSENRILALQVHGDSKVSMSVMRTVRGDSVDVSPALRVRTAIYGESSSFKTLSRSAAKLMSHADNGAIDSLKQLGIGGIYVVNSSSMSNNLRNDTNRLIANINASESTQLVVNSSNGAYCRFDGMPSKSSLSKTSPFFKARLLVWRTPWAVISALVILLYCIVAVPRFGSNTMLKRSDDEYEEGC
ncbi:glycosyltransferase family 2 protein [Gardnerella sp. 2492-Sm]|uniref:glycosyltransferase family 2 protein n=1 Tax=unclassified Gardnerella TaxID=2628112 RepID=UPI003D063A09